MKLELKDKASHGELIDENGEVSPSFDAFVQGIGHLRDGRVSEEDEERFAVLRACCAFRTPKYPDF